MPAAPRSRPQPQDHKRPAAETSAELYEFTGLDGKVYTLPPADALTGGLIRRTRHLDELDQSFTILEELLDAETLEALDNLPLEQFNDVMTGWQKHIGVSPAK